MFSQPHTPSPSQDRLPVITAPSHPDLPTWLQDLYPFATRALHLGSETMSFLDEGSPDAAPLLLLHGNPGWSFTFRRVVALLAEHCRVIAPDLVGFGLSSKPIDPRYHTLDRHISDVSVLVDALGLENITLVLHGWGGPIGTGFALAHPDRVRRIVFTNSWTSPLPDTVKQGLPWGVRLALNGAVGKVLDRLLRLSITGPLESGTGHSFPDLVVEGYKFPYAQGESRAAVRCFWRMFRDHDLPTARRLAEMQHRLSELQMPVDIVWGREDRLLNPKLAQRLQAAFENAGEVHFVNAAGHYLGEDCPADLATAILSEHSQPATCKKIG